MNTVKQKFIKIIHNFMEHVGYTKEWHGNWSEILNYLSVKYPYIKFQCPEYGFSVVFNIPIEYDYDEVVEYLESKFYDKYKITTFSDKARLIIITI